MEKLNKIYLEKNRRDSCDFFWKMNVLKVELLSRGIFVTHISKVMGEGVTDLWGY